MYLLETPEETIIYRGFNFYIYERCQEDTLYERVGRHRILIEHHHSIGMKYAFEIEVPEYPLKLLKIN